MTSKQTPVEWLMEQITYDNGYGGRWASFIETTDLSIFFEEAKVMEKEHKKIMFECGRNFQLTGEGTFEEIYKETYEKE